ncbi:MAG TPA: hypothetical protein VHK67_04735 [Rhabdochlamydiaceae bacterium]|jgi:hypothetical protein|nr:hypothetical protein [Rhabdochlamydiaceae bacterium]
MGKTVKFFSLLLMVVIAALSADPGKVADNFLSTIKERYRLTVTEVDPEHHCFKLSNKLICNLLQKNWETDPLPAIGDEVFLRSITNVYNRQWTRVEQGEVAVVIGSSGREVHVWISGESEYALFFLGTTSTCTGTSSDTNKEVFVLTDGSKWINKRPNMLNDLSEGDRVIVSRYSGNEYRLISLDSSTSFRLKNGKTGGMLAWQAVEPCDVEKATKE